MSSNEHSTGAAYPTLNTSSEYLDMRSPAFPGAEPFAHGHVASSAALHQTNQQQRNLPGVGIPRLVGLMPQLTFQQHIMNQMQFQHTLPTSSYHVPIPGVPTAGYLPAGPTGSRFIAVNQSINPANLVLAAPRAESQDTAAESVPARSPTQSCVAKTGGPADSVREGSIVAGSNVGSEQPDKKKPVMMRARRQERKTPAKPFEPSEDPIVITSDMTPQQQAAARVHNNLIAAERKENERRRNNQSAKRARIRKMATTVALGDEIIRLRGLAIRAAKEAEMWRSMVVLPEESLKQIGEAIADAAYKAAVSTMNSIYPAEDFPLAFTSVADPSPAPESNLVAPNTPVAAVGLPSGSPSSSSINDNNIIDDNSKNENSKSNNDESLTSQSASDRATQTNGQPPQCQLVLKGHYEDEVKDMRRCLRQYALSRALVEMCSEEFHEEIVGVVVRSEQICRALGLPLQAVIARDPEPKRSKSKKRKASTAVDNVEEDNDVEEE
ncbi:hypothetical protein VTK73DRAFT_4750 [Phialemonium thermophilum]|uniref:BZIP domain-containing protein n=1 Tax=Phialemonium thermophilum TaxID=223376 RepID=A0ABR3WRS8_9PEZI